MLHCGYSKLYKGQSLDFIVFMKVTKTYNNYHYVNYDNNFDFFVKS